MKKRALAVALVVSIAAPIAAFGQSNDAQYCQALADKYRKEVGTQAAASADVPVAMSKCQSGDYAAAIPVLEKALKDNKVPLPARQ